MSTEILLENLNLNLNGSLSSRVTTQTQNSRPFLKDTLERLLIKNESKIEKFGQQKKPDEQKSSMTLMRNFSHSNSTLPSNIQMRRPIQNFFRAPMNSKKKSQAELSVKTEPFLEIEKDHKRTACYFEQSIDDYRKIGTSGDEISTSLLGLSEKKTSFDCPLGSKINVFSRRGCLECKYKNNKISHLEEQNQWLKNELKKLQLLNQQYQNNDQIQPRKMLNELNKVKEQMAAITTEKDIKIEQYQSECQSIKENYLKEINELQRLIITKNETINQLTNNLVKYDFISNQVVNLENTIKDITSQNQFQKEKLKDYESQLKFLISQNFTQSDKQLLFKCQLSNLRNTAIIIAKLINVLSANEQPTIDLLTVNALKTRPQSNQENIFQKVKETDLIKILHKLSSESTQFLIESHFQIDEALKTFEQSIYLCQQKFLRNILQ